MLRRNCSTVQFRWEAVLTLSLNFAKFSSWIVIWSVSPQNLGLSIRSPDPGVRSTLDDHRWHRRLLLRCCAHGQGWTGQVVGDWIHRQVSSGCSWFLLLLEQLAVMRGSKDVCYSQWPHYLKSFKQKDPDGWQFFDLCRSFYKQSIFLFAQNFLPRNVSPVECSI